MRIQFKNTNMYKKFNTFFKLCSKHVKNNKIKMCFRLKKLLSENPNLEKCNPIIEKYKDKETRIIVGLIKKELKIDIKMGQEWKVYNDYVEAYKLHKFSRESFDTTRKTKLFDVSRSLEVIQSNKYKPYKYKFYIKLKKIADSLGIVIEELNEIIKEIKDFFFKNALSRFGIDIKYYEVKDLLESYDKWYDKNHNGQYLKV